MGSQWCDCLLLMESYMKEMDSSLIFLLPPPFLSPCCCNLLFLVKLNLKHSSRWYFSNLLQMLEDLLQESILSTVSWAGAGYQMCSCSWNKMFFTLNFHFCATGCRLQSNWDKHLFKNCIARLTCDKHFRSAFLFAFISFLLTFLLVVFTLALLSGSSPFSSSLFSSLFPYTFFFHLSCFLLLSHCLLSPKHCSTSSQIPSLYMDMIKYEVFLAFHVLQLGIFPVLSMHCLGGCLHTNISRAYCWIFSEVSWITGRAKTNQIV